MNSISFQQTMTIIYVYIFSNIQFSLNIRRELVSIRKKGLFEWSLVKSVNFQMTVSAMNNEAWHKKINNNSTTSLDKYRNTNLFVFPIPVCLETIRRMKLNGGAADHLNATFLIFSSRWTYTTIHLHVVPTNTSKAWILDIDAF